MKFQPVRKEEIKSEIFATEKDKHMKCALGVCVCL